MSKKIVLKIDQPCHEDWNRMTGADKGRFCAACKKEVVDFTTMSDAQLAAWFKKPAGSVCGRLAPDQLNREISIPKKRLPWVKYFFQITLPAFLFSARSNAQGEVKVRTNYTQVPSKQNPDTQTEFFSKEKTKIFNGYVLDQNRKPVQGAVVMLKKEYLYCVTDKNGWFQIEGSDAESYLLVTAENFITSKIDVRQQKVFKIILQPEFTGVMGVMIMVDSSEKQKPVETATKKVKKEPVVKPLKQRRTFIETDPAISRDLPATGIKPEEVSPALAPQPVQLSEPLLEGYVGGISVDRPMSRGRMFLHARQQSRPAAFMVFPNPVPPAGALNIEWKRKEHGELILSLANEAGQEVLTQKQKVEKGQQSFTMSLPGLPPGLYLLTIIIKDSGKNFTEKIIVSN
jgi:hypothetical protein